MTSTDRATLDYYNSNAEAFRKRTLVCGVQSLYDAFLAMLPPGAHILDAGCGPGRDSVAFLGRGYRVTAVDASAAMVEIATRTIGQQALLLPFQEVDFIGMFDGIWANASLLHVPTSQIDDVMDRLTRALKPGGILYMSVKQGEGARTIADGRRFYDYTQSSLRELLARRRELHLVEIHETPPGAGQVDPRPWLHATVKKLGSAA